MWWVSTSLLAAILIYGIILVRYIPERLHFAANSIASLLAILLAIYNGLAFADIGLGIHFISKGLFVAAACSIIIMIVAGLITLFVPQRKLTHIPEIMRPGKVAYETAVRIPLSTALSEEILFRGVLLGIIMQHSSTLVAVIISSLAFGLWHALPSLRDHSKAAVLPIIIATSIAGLFFCWLRVIANSLVAPWLIHWTVNASALLAIHFMRKKMHDNP